MKKRRTSESGVFNVRTLFTFALCSTGTLLAMLSFAAAPLSADPMATQHVGLSASAELPFTAVGSMSAPRYEHTTTLLPNGKILVAGGYRVEAGTSVVTDTAEVFDPATGTFTLIPNKMTSRRYLHTATLLPDGKVLIVGGAKDFSGTVNTAELFDPASQTFTLLPNTMKSPRDSHTATLLSNGKVLLAGGFKGDAATNTAELFDPVAGTFTSVPNTMTSARNNHTATLLQSGKVLIAGGFAFAAALNTAEVFDPISETFALVPSAMSSARNVHTATLLPSGKVLIAGGQTGVASLNTAELFDPVSQAFTLLPPMSSPRYFHTATLLPSGKILIAGGTPGGLATNTVELFDPALGAFTLAPNIMTSGRYLHTATLLPSGAVLIVGGHTGSSAGTGPLNTAEVFDPTSGSFTTAVSLNVARFFPTATLLPNGKVLIAGGEPGTGPTRTAELFDPVTGTFSMLPNQMNVGRLRHTATLLPSGKVLIAGGDTSSVGTGATDRAELFNPVSETFTLLPPMTSPRWSHTATLLANGKVLLTGGIATADFHVANTAELFDPASGTFSSVDAMNSARDFHTATLLSNGKVLIAGGFNPSVGGYDTAELFDPVSNSFTLLPSLMTTKRYYHSATLLPNGQVFIAGGGGSAPPVVSGAVITNTAELFDPATGTFTLIPNTMSSYRYWQTATLLPSGKVLLADGSTADFAGSQYTRTAELFDPSTKTFTLLPLMNSVRFGHTATLLRSGQVLIAAGTTGSTATNTAEIFDLGLGFSDARRPILSTATLQNGSLTITGTGFRGDSEGSGGSFSNSATNYPLLQLTRIDNEQSFFVRSDPATNWSDTTFSSETLANLPAGQYRATIFTNAIPSLQKIIKIGLPVQLVGVVSRKVHGTAGTFDVDLPVTGPRGIECRSAGATGDHTLVFTFANPLASVGSASITSGNGSINSSAIDSNDAHLYIVHLTGVANAQAITVSLANVSDSAGNGGNTVSASMGVLLGDVNANGVVTNTDVAAVKGQVAAPVSGANFRTDENANGVISNTDVSSTKTQVGTSLP